MSLRRRDLLLGPLIGPLGAGLGAALGACAAVPAPPPPRRIVFGSCADQDAPQEIWDSVASAQPDLLILGGDNVYISHPAFTAAAARQAYAQLAAQPGFARLRQRIPVLATWDDNDYGLNDGGAEFAHKQASKDALLAFLGTPADDARRAHEGVYDAQCYGPPGHALQVILLDGRWFRSPWRPTDQRGAPGRERFLVDDDPSKTMLGAAQWAWLEARLREPAALRLLVSGTQVLAADHGWERWGLFPHELARLRRLIASTGAHNTLLLSGDRHFGAFYRDDTDRAHPLHECTASGWTHPWAKANERVANQLVPPVGVKHFALIELDWATRRVGIALRAADNHPVQQLTLDHLMSPAP